MEFECSFPGEVESGSGKMAMAMAMEEVDSMALLPFGSISGDFIRQCGGSPRSVSSAQGIGVNYGSLGDNLPDVTEVIQLYKSNGIGKMRLYHANEAMLNALRGSNIEIIIGVTNSDLQRLADLDYAKDWVSKNIQAYIPSVKFRYIAVGNEWKATEANPQYVLPAMQNIYRVLLSANLQDQIKVSTVIDISGLGSSFPPSAGSFSTTAREFIKPIVSFLVDHGSPLLANVYPYFSYLSNPQSVKLSYALFTSSEVIVTDGNREYRNLFESIVDALYSALEKSGGGDVPIVVSESGWPSNGSVAATVGNAGTYYKNLISYVQSGSGTPRRPGIGIETYLFAIFDENMKAPEYERHFGLFTPNKQPKYSLTFSKKEVD